MRIMIISDIHGSAGACEQAMKHFDELAPDLLFVLGDVLYHGPRNPLPGGHNPKKVAELLNRRKDKIVAVRGNCDAEIDQMLLEFPMMGDYALAADGTRRLFLTHGHLWTRETFPWKLPRGSVIFSGHTHIAGIETDSDGITWCNPGSTSLPKADRGPTWAWYENGKIDIRDL
jgi:putative phosphoesterase